MDSEIRNCDADVQYCIPLSVAVVRFARGFSFKGRSSRSEFWWALLFSFVLDLGVSVIMRGTMLYNCFFLVMIILNGCLGCRRMHDIGKSGWWYFVPFYNLFVAAFPSEPGENKFGCMPNVQRIVENPNAKKTVLAIMVVCILIALIRGIIGGDSQEVIIEKPTDGVQELTDEINARILTELMWQAQREQYNHQSQIDLENKRKKWQQEQNEWGQYQKRKQQIIDDEYQRLKAREGYREGVPKNRLYFD